MRRSSFWTWRLTPPVIICPAAISVDCDGADGSVVDFSVTASDSCDASLDVVSDPPSGSLFPEGTTVVTNTATDSSGNVAMCTFEVIVGTCAGGQVPGDCNQDGTLDVSDVHCTLNHLFLDASIRLPCGDGSAADEANRLLLSWNGAEADVDLSAVVRLLDYLFLGGREHVLGKGCVPIVGCPVACEPGA